MRPQRWNRLLLVLMVLAGAVIQGLLVTVFGLAAAAPVVFLAILGLAMRVPMSVVLMLVVYLPLEGFILKAMPGGAVAYLMVLPEAVLAVAAISATVSARERGQDVYSWWLAVVGSITLLALVSAAFNGIGVVLGAYWLRLLIRYSTAALVVAAAAAEDPRGTVKRLGVACAVSISAQLVPALIEVAFGIEASGFFMPASVVYAGQSVLTYKPKAIIHGTMGFYNNLGNFASVCMVICASAFVATDITDKRSRNWLAFGALAGATCVLLSTSRQAVLAAGVAVLVLVMTQAQRRRGKIVSTVVIVMIVVTALSPLFPQIGRAFGAVTGRFSEAFTSDYVAASLATDRLFALFKAVPVVLRKYPLVGLGPGATSGRSTFLDLPTIEGVAGYGVTPLAYIQDVGWAGLLVQLGFGGGIWLLVATVSAIRRAHAIRGTVHDGGAYGTVLGAVVVIWVAMFASFPLFVRGTSALLWCVLGVAIGAKIHSENNPDVAGAGQPEPSEIAA